MSTSILFLALVLRLALPVSLAVPEFSPPLEQRPLPGLQLSNQPSYFFSRGEQVGVVQADGRLFRFDPRTLQLQAGETLPFPLAKESTVSDGLAWLSHTDNQTLLLYDLEAGKVLGQWAVGEGERIRAVDRSVRVVSQGRMLRVERLQDGKTIFAKELEATSLRLQGGILFGTAGRRFFRLDTRSGKYRQSTLAEPAQGDGWLGADHFYYGTEKRALACHSLLSNRPSWKVGLPDVLAFSPFSFRSRIVAVTRGDAVLFLTRRGSVDWWLALPSYLRTAPLALVDHLAFLLQSNELFLVSLRQRSALRFTLDGEAAGAPYPAAGYLFFLLRAVGSQEGMKVVRVGSRVGIEMTQKPEKPLANRMLLLAFSLHNLPRARLAVRLEDSEGRPILEKEFASVQPLSLAWIPPAGGKYRLKARATTPGASVENAFEINVIDWNDFLRGLQPLFLPK